MPARPSSQLRRQELASGVPINLVQRSLGRARLSTTMIYLNVSGPEERRYGERFWTAS